MSPVSVSARDHLPANASRSPSASPTTEVSDRAALDIVRFLLETEDAEAMAARAVTSLGLLPSVAWAELSHHFQPAYGRCAVTLGTQHPRQLLVVQLKLPLDSKTAEDMRVLLGLIDKVHQRLHELERLRNDARTDPLTGLWNRRGFLPLVDQAVARHRRHGESIALLMCDLDHLKPINDTFGHEAGDRTLCAVSESMRSIIRPTDFAARLGGDEFAILLAGANAAGALAVAERLRQSIASQARRGPRPLTLSIGIADARVISPASSDAEARDALLRTADAALYVAKDEGRDRACVDALCMSIPVCITGKRRTATG